MKIKKLHITGFGAMKNCELFLEDNFNLIHGNNEYGKTTIFSFIRAMLFGLKGVSKAIKEDYEKYLPLDNPHNYKGEMYLELHGINYKIERNFHRDTRSSKITDIDNGKILKENEWANLLLPLDFETFTSTCYINSDTGYPGEKFMQLLQERIIGLAESNSGDILVHNCINSLAKSQKSRTSKIKSLTEFNEITAISRKNKIDTKIKEIQDEIEDIKLNKFTFGLPLCVSATILAMLAIFTPIYRNNLSIMLLLTFIFINIILIAYTIKKYNNYRNLELQVKQKNEFYLGQLKELYTQKASIDLLIDKNNTNKIEAKKLKKELDALALARTTINELAKEMYSKNTYILNSRLSEIFSKITDKSFKGVFVNDDMNIYAVREDNTLYGLNNLSRGTLEQLYLSLRLVTIDLIYNDLNLPIIIDDGFVHYDYKRYKNVMDILTKLNNQVIIFNLSKSVF